ncbi:MAG: PDGLE domain-containing protein [Actinomycetota bacterium]
MNATSNTRLFVVAGLLLACALVLFVSPFANPNPDGLNRVAEDEGFAATETDHGLGDSPLADYAVHGVDHEGVSKGLSGVIGILATFGLGLGLFALARKRRAGGSPANSSGGPV